MFPASGRREAKNSGIRIQRLWSGWEPVDVGGSARQCPPLGESAGSPNEIACSRRRVPVPASELGARPLAILPIGGRARALFLDGILTWGSLSGSISDRAIGISHAENAGTFMVL